MIVHWLASRIACSVYFRCILPLLLNVPYQPVHQTRRVQTAAAGHAVGHKCNRKPKQQTLWTQAIVGKTAYKQQTYRKAYESDKPDTQDFESFFYLTYCLSDLQTNVRAEGD